MIAGKQADLVVLSVEIDTFLRLKFAAKRRRARCWIAARWFSCVPAGSRASKLLNTLVFMGMRSANGGGIRAS
ncbi:hypothetical protein Ga0102493_111379 [Erythrobacter litoralis]|uniref:Uncharacterized protein n=1 Tax=Erythrobacter litoralis TaxID=39960 RepID=A0A074MAS1_9SPHN|nr:hypothetical protein [Erythrobacter litoralis]AOL22407.1 hypothetical protein Ga0102493_111379 [Erythrobacter litoralis]KEO88938.1 hypothetical protein EH32_04490 [Erythrobacter litoralis]